jgi:hypothetical protein
MFFVRVNSGGEDYYICSGEAINIEFSIINTNEDIDGNNFLNEPTHGFITKSHCGSTEYTLTETLEINLPSFQQFIPTLQLALSDWSNIPFPNYPDQNPISLDLEKDFENNYFVESVSNIENTNYVVEYSPFAEDPPFASILPRFVKDIGNDGNLVIIENTMRINPAINWYYPKEGDVPEGFRDCYATMIHELAHSIGIEHDLKFESFDPDFLECTFLPATFMHNYSNQNLMGPGPTQNPPMIPFNERLNLTGPSGERARKAAEWIVNQSMNYTISEETKSEYGVVSLSENFDPISPGDFVVQDNNNQLEIFITENTVRLPIKYRWETENGAHKSVVFTTEENLITFNYAMLPAAIGASPICLRLSDANNCEIVSCFEIVDFNCEDEFDISETILNPCSGEANGSISLVIDGGMSPYTVEWSTGEEGLDVNNLENGFYSYTLTDSDGCALSNEDFLLPNANLSIQNSLVEPICGSNSGSINIQIDGNWNMPYTFEWSNGTNSQNLENVTTPGLYTVTVTDNNNCSIEQTFEVISGNTGELEIYCFPTTCATSSDGRATAFLPGANPGDLQYQWSNGSTSNPALFLAPGPYSVTVTDLNGCQYFENVVIETGDGFYVNETLQKVSCLDGATGSISLYINGLNSPYSYNWDSPDYPNFSATTKDINNLESGTYCVTVTDYQGCEEYRCWDISKEEVWPYVKEVKVSLISAPNTTIYRGTWQPLAENCLKYVKDEDYFVTDEALQALATFTGLRVEIFTSTDMSKFISCISGYGSSSFQSPSNSEAIWIFNVFGPSIVVNNGINQQLSMTGIDLNGNALLSLGNNGLEDCVDVPTLDDNCVWTPIPITGEDLSHVIGEPCIVVELNVDENASTIDANIQGVSPPFDGYYFFWSKDGNNISDDVENNSISYLESGEYCVRVITSEGCWAEECVTICENLDQYQLVVTTPTCQDDPPAQVCFQPGNGFALNDIQVDWALSNGMNFQDKTCIGDIPAGTYSVQLTVTYGDCQVAVFDNSFEIEQTIVLPLSIASITNPLVDCPWTPEGEGEICVEVTGGNPPYEFSWPGGSTDNCFTEAHANRPYIVEVTDQCGVNLIVDDLYTASANQLLYTIVDIQDAICNANSGSVSIIMAGGEGDFNVSWKNLTTGTIGSFISPTGDFEIIGLEPGNFEVVVYTPCTSATPITFNIDQQNTPPVPFGIEEAKVVNICSEGSLGLIQIGFLFGDTENAPFTYEWNTGATTPSITNLSSGDIYGYHYESIWMCHYGEFRY